MSPSGLTLERFRGDPERSRVGPAGVGGPGAKRWGRLPRSGLLEDKVCPKIIAQ